MCRQVSVLSPIDVKNMTSICVVPRTIQPVSLADKAYQAIRELIVSLELAPGAVIDERELMERLGIGRTPVREALRRLAHERLVEVYPRRGMFVTTVDVRDLARLCEVRAVLEPEAARLAAERATKLDLEGINALIEELLDPRRRDDRALIDLDERIHRTIYRTSHNQLLEAIHDGDSQRAAETMRAHVQNFEQAMHRVLLTV